MQKRIITWTGGNNAERNEWTFSRGFIFGNYGDSAADYMKLIDEAVKDFPHLKPPDIVIGKVTESSYMKGFALASFLLPANQKHPEYDAWDRFDFSY